MRKNEYRGTVYMLIIMFLIIMYFNMVNAEKIESSPPVQIELDLPKLSGDTVLLNS